MKKWISCSLILLVALAAAGWVWAELSERAVVAMVRAGGG